MAIAVAPNLEHASAEEVLAYAVERFHPRLFVACSFQKEASVIMDMLVRIEPEARFFTLDTGVLFQETHDTWRELEQRYGTKVEVFKGISLEEQARRHGDELWNRDPDACCGIRKVEPMRRALSSVDCWVAGVRRADSSSRSKTPKFGWDKRFNLWKLNPLADWTERDVWNYIREHHLPYNPLHDRGYPSIGCTHCTQPVEPGGDLRAGRWTGLAKTECGIN
jgi:phosphoadenosine phosphosulfate reductase